MAFGLIGLVGCANGRHVGRFQIVETKSQPTIMLDTATGTVWRQHCAFLKDMNCTNFAWVRDPVDGIYEASKRPSMAIHDPVFGFPLSEAMEKTSTPRSE